MKRTVLVFAVFLLWSLALFAEAPEFSLDKEWPRMPEGWKFRMVSNIAGDSKGRIYVAHRGAHPVVFFDKTGKFLGSMGEGVFQQSVNYNLTVNPPIPISREYWAHGLHVDPSDNVWVTDLGRQVVMKFSREGRLLMTLGTLDQSGESPKNFHQPSSVAVAPSGDIYVADGYGNSRVVKFSPDGKYLKVWGKKGSGPGEFDTPHGIAVDAKGNVYVAERLNNRIQVFDSEGRFLAQWANYSRADSIFITRKGLAYVGTGKGDIYKLDLSGRLLQTIGTEKALGYPHGIFVDSEGSLYIADPIANSASQPPRRFVKK